VAFWGSEKCVVYKHTVEVYNDRHVCNDHVCVLGHSFIHEVCCIINPFMCALFGSLKGFRRQRIRFWSILVHLFSLSSSSWSLSYPVGLIWT